MCIDAARRRGLQRLLLLGTRFTMEAPFYPDASARAGITLVVPDADARAWIHEAYVNELLKGDFRDSTRARFTSYVADRRLGEGVEGVILGGTELPLLLPGDEVAGVPALDTTALHVAAIVRRLRAD